MTGNTFLSLLRRFMRLCCKTLTSKRRTSSVSPREELHDLPAQYAPGQTERAIYERWVEAGVFSADEKCSKRNGGDRDPFVVIMPPPNVTSVLHMGHGLNNTVQDVIIRWRRMVGDEALWVPGTDHAG